MQLHAMVVHFPIALLLTGVAFDLIGLRLGREDLRRAGLYVLGVGLAGAVLALFTGALGEETAEEIFPGVEYLGDVHKFLAIAATALFGTLFVWRLRGGQSGRAAIPYTALAIAAVIVLAATGHSGGRMVYDQQLSGGPQLGGERGGFGNFGEGGERGGSGGFGERGEGGGFGESGERGEGILGR